MAERSAEAITRADVIVAAWLARQPLRSRTVGISLLIDAIAEALDDLAGAINVLMEGIRNDEAADSEAMRTRLAVASAALCRHQGQPPGRLA